MSEIRSRGVLARAQPAVIVPTNPAQVASGRRHCATVGATVPTKPANPSALLCTGWHGTGSGLICGSSRRMDDSSRGISPPDGLRNVRTTPSDQPKRRVPGQPKRIVPATAVSLLSCDLGYAGITSTTAGSVPSLDGRGSSPWSDLTGTIPRGPPRRTLPTLRPPVTPPEGTARAAAGNPSVLVAAAASG